MPLRTPDEYRQALRDRREVYMWGERVPDVTTHPALRWAVDTAALDYEMAEHPKLRELARDTLFSARASGRGYFRRGFVEDLYRKYEADTSTYYGDTVWTFLILELWHRQAVDQPVGVGA